MAYFEPWNTCFRKGPSPERVELLRRSGLGNLRSDIVFGAPSDDADGEIDRTVRDGERDIVVSGRVSLATGNAPDAVVLSRVDAPGTIFAIAQELRPVGNGARWKVRLGPLMRQRTPQRVVAWAYDRERGRLLPFGVGTLGAGEAASTDDRSGRIEVRRTDLCRAARSAYSDVRNARATPDAMPRLVVR